MSFRHRAQPRGKSEYPRSTRVKVSQFVNSMCSHCLFPVVDKSGTNVDSQQVVPTSQISSARNKLL
jgi:hypothetical protein